MNRVSFPIETPVKAGRGEPDMMQAQGGRYRYELKYVCSDLQLAQMEERLKKILKPDSHADGGGFYTIRSLYFDDYYDTALREKEDGVNLREKYRLRYYNRDVNLVRLEIKQKAGSKIRKESCRVTKEEADGMIEGNWYQAAQSGDRVAGRLFLKGALCLMQPKVIVEYDRFPYVCEEGNVRITFDKNIRSASGLEDFWRDRLPTRPVMPAGWHLLEVKFDEFLPDHIYRTLQMEHLTQTAFSKYALCRRYALGALPGADGLFG